MERMDRDRPRPATRALLLIAAGTLGLGGLAGCRDAPPAEPPEVELPAVEVGPAHRTVPTGTSMTFRLDETVSTRTHGAGDLFTATLYSNVTDVEGTPVIPEGSSSQWLVSEALTNEGRTVIAVELQSVRVDGAWVPMAAQATDATLVPEIPSNREAPEVGVGDGADSLIGAVLGDGSSTVTATVGEDPREVGAVAIATRGLVASLPAGSAVVVRLSGPVQLAARQSAPPTRP